MCFYVMYYLFNITWFFLFIVTLWVWWRKRKFTIFQRNGIPGPEPNFWTGNLKEFVEKREKCIGEYVKKYGPVVGCFIGPKPWIFVTDPELLKIIQVKEFKMFTNRDGIIPDAGIPIVSFLHSVTIAKDENWKRTRCILNPTFTSGKLKKMMSIFNEVVDIFLKKIEEKAKNKEFFDIHSMFKNVAMDAITKSGFGINTNVQHGENSLFLDSAELCLKPDSKDVSIALSMCFPELEPIPTKLRKIIDKIKFRLNFPSVRKLFNIVDELIVQRKQSAQKKNDLLQSLIDERIDDKKLQEVQLDELGTREYTDKLETDIKGKESDKNTAQKVKIGLTDEMITTNLVTFLVAGFDTISATMGFFASLVSRHPEIQEKIRLEINEFVNEDRDIEYDDLINFKYLDQVISETMRLYPTGEMTVNRMASESYNYKGMTIPKGVTISVATNILHRNPEYWPDPDKFIPERFSAENKSKINPITYQSFGYGPRNCMGIRYAQTLMKLVLARFIRSYQMECFDDEDCSVDYSLFVNHPEEVKIKVIPT